MTNAEHIAQARERIQALKVTDKMRAFLLKGLDLVMDKPIHSIDIFTSFKSAKYSVFYEDGDEREVEATFPKPKEG